MHAQALDSHVVLTGYRGRTGSIMSLPLKVHGIRPGRGLGGVSRRLGRRRSIGGGPREA
jgi:hypothetical protein